jgi:hypothetical protein
MSLDTYANLLSAVQSVLDDTTSVVTTPQADWVTLCEQRIFYGAGVHGDQFYSPPIRCRQIEAPFTLRVEAIQDGGTSGGSANAQTVTLDSAPTLALGVTIKFTAGFTNTGACTLNANGTGNVDIRKGVNNDALEEADIMVGGAYAVYHDGTYYKLLPHLGAVPLPSRFLGFKQIYDQGTNEQPLEPFGPAQLSGQLGVNETGSPIQAYAISGDYIRFSPLPDSTRFIKGIMWRKPSTLSSALNQLFRDAPGLWLYGTLLEGCLWLGQNDDALKFYPIFKAAINGVAKSSRADRTGSSPRIMRPYGPIV